MRMSIDSGAFRDGFHQLEARETAERYNHCFVVFSFRFLILFSLRVRCFLLCLAVHLQVANLFYLAERAAFWPALECGIP